MYQCVHVSNLQGTQLHHLVAAVIIFGQRVTEVALDRVRWIKEATNVGHEAAGSNKN